MGQSVIKYTKSQLTKSFLLALDEEESLKFKFYSFFQAYKISEKPRHFD